jgi:predicted lipoprotein with Yx(FWY)xxD motif
MRSGPPAVPRPTARPRRVAALPAALAVVVVALLTLVPQPDGADGTAQDSPIVRVRETSLGRLLTDAAGMTLYVYDGDAPGESRCVDLCAELWPPLRLDGDPPVLLNSLPGITTLARPDGGRQLQYDGRPLYRFSGDRATGDVNGDGRDGAWWAARAAVVAVPPAPPSTSPPDAFAVTQTPAAAIPPRAATIDGAAAAPGTVLLDERFSSAADGRIAAPSLVAGGYVDGEYVVRGTGPTRSVELPVDVADATIAVDVRLLGDVMQRTVSVGCRLRQTTEGAYGYRLRVEPGAGLYRLVREDGARDHFLRSDRRSTAIRSGTMTNRLELTCSGTTITAVINGVEVARIQDSTYREGPWTFGAGARQPALPVEARFDNLILTRR